MNVIIGSTYANRYAITVSYDPHHISIEFFSIFFLYHYAIRFYVKDKMNVDFYKRLCHVLNNYMEYSLM